MKQYSVNAANHLILVFINNNEFILEQNNNKNNEIISSNKFYEKFNEILIAKNNDINCFSDFRSCFIDLLNGFTNCIRDLYIIFQEENTSENKDKKITKIIQFILTLFFDKFIQNSSHKSPNSKIFLAQTEAQKNVDGIKYNTQLLMELEILVQILKKYLNEKLVEKSNICKNIILGYLARIKGLNGNLSEKEILTQDEIRNKNNLIKSFLPNYDTFYKIFN